MLPLACCFVFVFFADAWRDVSNFEDGEFSYDGTRYYKELIKTFTKNREIVHTDGVLKYKVNELLKNWHHPTLIYNHESGAKIQRPGYGTFINVAILSNYTNFAHYLSNPRNIFSGDVLIIIAANEKYVPENKNNFWTLPYSNRFGNVLIVNFIGKYVHVFNVCYYCGPFSGLMRHLDTAIKHNDTKITIQKDKLVGRPFTHFHGKHFRIKAVLYFPLVWGYVKKRDNKTKLFGAHIKLLQVLSLKMNFTYTLEQCMTYEELLRDLEEEKADFSIGGVKLTANRKNSLPYIQPLRTEEIHLIFKYRASLGDKMFLLFFTFDYLVWLVLFIFLIFLSCMAFSYLKHFKIKDKFFKSIEVALRSLLEQSWNYSFYKLRIYCFVFLTTWWIFCIQIDTAFKAKLSSLMIQPPEDNLRNIKELYSYGYDVATNLDGDVDLMSLLKSMKIAESRIVTRPDLCTSFKYIMKNKAALIGTYADTVYHVQLLCNKDKFFEKGMRITDFPVALSEHGWTFKTGAPFSIGFHDIVGRLQASGFILKWERDVVYRHQRRIAMRKLKALKGSSNFSPYFSQFSIYCIGMGVSAICFIGEIIYHRYCPAIYLPYLN